MVDEKKRKRLTAKPRPLGYAEMQSKEDLMLKEFQDRLDIIHTLNLNNLGFQLLLAHHKFTHITQSDLSSDTILNDASLLKDCHLITQSLQHAIKMANSLISENGQLGMRELTEQMIGQQPDDTLPDTFANIAGIADLHNTLRNATVLARILNQGKQKKGIFDEVLVEISK